MKWQLFLHSAQLESVRHDGGWVCRDGNLADDYAAPLSDRVKHTDWFQDAHLSTWAFSAILDLVEDAGWQLVIFENPLHPSYLELANQASLNAYLDLMHASAEAPHVHYLHMGWDALPNSAFFDFHHLSCEGQLDLLEGLSGQGQSRPVVVILEGRHCWIEVLTEHKKSHHVGNTLCLIGDTGFFRDLTVRLS